MTKGTFRRLTEKIRLLIVILVIIAIITSSFVTTSNAKPNPSPKPTVTPTPTATPIPTILPTPTPSPTITPSPTPTPPPSSGLIVKGITAMVDNLYYSPNVAVPSNYQSNGWSDLQGLGINVIRVGEGPEGDVAHFNPLNYPNEWANNLNSFLTIANNHGMRVTFQEMGTQWQTLFGIVPPEPAKGIVGTSIAQSKILIDELAGNNVPVSY